MTVLSAFCPECRRTIGLNLDGTYRKHLSVTFKRACNTSGQPVRLKVSLPTFYSALFDDDLDVGWAVGAARGGALAASLAFALTL